MHSGVVTKSLLVFETLGFVGEHEMMMNISSAVVQGNFVCAVLASSIMRRRVKSQISNLTGATKHEGYFFQVLG